MDQYYFVDGNTGSEQGPVNYASIRDKRKSGEFTDSTLVRHISSGEFTPLAKCLHIRMRREEEIDYSKQAIEKRLDGSRLLGWVRKKKVDWRRLGYKNRFLVLEKGHLLYYDVKGERALRAKSGARAEPKGDLYLGNASMKMLEKLSFKLKVVEPKAKEFIFECSSLEHKHEICELVSEHINLANKHKTAVVEDQLDKEQARALQSWLPSTSISSSFASPQGREQELQPAVIMKGFLNQLVGKKIRKWKKRYFELEEKYLAIYRSADSGWKDAEPGRPYGRYMKWRIKLGSKIEVSGYTGDKRGFYFCLSTPTKMFHFRAPTAEEKGDWISGLRQNLERISTKRALEGSNYRQSRTEGEIAEELDQSSEDENDKEDDGEETTQWSISTIETEPERAKRENRRKKLNEAFPLRAFEWSHKRRFGVTSYARPGWTQSEVMLTVMGEGTFPSQMEYIGVDLSVSAPTNFIIDEKQCQDSFPGQKYSCVLRSNAIKVKDSKAKAHTFYFPVSGLVDHMVDGDRILRVEVIAYSGGKPESSLKIGRSSKRSSATRSIKLIGTKGSDVDSDSGGNSQGRCIGRIYCTLRSILDRPTPASSSNDKLNPVSMLTSSWMTACIRMIPLAWTDSLFGMLVSPMAAAHKTMKRQLSREDDGSGGKLKALDLRVLVSVSKVRCVKPKICKCYGLEAQTFRLSLKSSRENPLLPASMASAPPPPGASVPPKLMVREEIYESGMAFQVPAAYLAYRLAQWKKYATNFKLLNAEIFAADPPNLSDREKTDRKHLRLMFTKIEGATKVCEQLAQLYGTLQQIVPPNSYQGKHLDMTFKPSVKKGDSSLRGIPTNLHLHLMRVGICKDFAQKDTAESANLGENSPVAGYRGEHVYDFVTFGAPAAHIYKFKGGGASKMCNLVKTWRDGAVDLAGYIQSEAATGDIDYYSDENSDEEAKPSDLDSILGSVEFDAIDKANQVGKTPLPLSRKTLGISLGAAPRKSAQLQQSKELRRRADLLELDARMRLDVAVSQCVTALVTSFTYKLEYFARYKPEALDQIASIGFLFGVESLLSTFKSEMGMLEDMDRAVRELARFEFELVSSKSPRTSSASSSGSRAGSLDSHIRNMQMQSSDGGIPEDLESADFHHDDDGWGGMCIVTLEVPREIFACLPPSLSKHHKRIKVVPIMFTQGINEFQTAANKTGHVFPMFQQKINMENRNRLQGYFNAALSANAQLAGDAPKWPWGDSQKRIADSMKAMAKLTQNIKKSKVGSKDYQVLLAAEDAIRSLNGGRAVCCKSAKDRTSMAVTLEEARLLCAHHGLPGRLDHDFDPDVLCAANVFRELGVRLPNAEKNTGKKRFAFNNVQRKFLPKLYRPPRSCIGSNIN